MASRGGFIVRSLVGSSASSDNGYSTLVECLGKGGIDMGDDLVVLFSHIQYACKRKAALVASSFNSSLGKRSILTADGSGSDRDEPKPLDIVSNENGRVVDTDVAEKDTSSWTLYVWTVLKSSEFFQSFSCNYGEQGGGFEDEDNDTTGATEKYL